VPIYDYVCSACGHRFEVLRGLNEAGPGQCPLCEGPVARAFAPPTILFKGSGWAKKDRRSTGAPSRKAATGEAKGPGSGESGQAEAGSGGSGQAEAGSGASGEAGSSRAGESAQRAARSESTGDAAAPKPTGTDD
jgi:putative FmdB family regulatory protein